jgi:hypothetical protein
MQSGKQHVKIEVAAGADHGGDLHGAEGVDLGEDVGANVVIH